MQVEMSSFVQQELSNVMWAYGTMQYQPNPHFMQRAAQEMLNRGISKFLPQAISNACWALAKLDLIFDDFLEVLCSAHTYCPVVLLCCLAVCECVQAKRSCACTQVYPDAADTDRGWLNTCSCFLVTEHLA